MLRSSEMHSAGTYRGVDDSRTRIRLVPPGWADVASLMSKRTLSKLIAAVIGACVVVLGALIFWAVRETLRELEWAHATLDNNYNNAAFVGVIVTLILTCASIGLLVVAARLWRGRPIRCRRILAGKKDKISQP